MAGAYPGDDADEDEDLIAKEVDAVITEIETICRPLVNREPPQQR